MMLNRLYTRVFVRGAGERWRKLGKELWMSLVTTMTMMMKNETLTKEDIPIILEARSYRSKMYQSTDKAQVAPMLPA